MAPRGKAQSRALALIPLGVGLVLGALVLPRPAPPDDVPRPRIDAAALRAIERGDDARAASVTPRPLPHPVRAVGSALRAFLRLQSQDDAEPAALSEGRRRLDAAVTEALAEGGTEELLRLRAFHLDAFLRAVARYEATGQEDTDLLELGGGFVRRFRRAGWLRGRSVVLGAAERRAAFKLAWNGAVGVESLAPFALSLDEQRALYSAYIAHPHAPEAVLAQLEAARSTARDRAACEALDEGARLAAETWRLEKVKKLAQLDPDYPGLYAVGIAQFRRGAYPAAAQAFRDWLDAHPEGPYALRARSYLRAALVADTNTP